MLCTIKIVPSGRKKQNYTVILYLATFSSEQSPKRTLFSHINNSCSTVFLCETALALPGFPV